MAPKADKPTLTVTPDKLEVGQYINVGWEHQGEEGHLKVTRPDAEQWFGASGTGSLSIPAVTTGTYAFELKGPDRKALREAQRATVSVVEPGSRRDDA